jgi:hypothetical protein
MITKEEWGAFKELRSKLGSSQGKIEAHMHKVLEMICEVYDGKLDWWQYPSYDCDRCDGEMSINGDSIDISVSHSAIGDYYFEEFPLEYLFKSVDDIRKIVVKEKEAARIAAEKDKAKKKEQRLARKAKKAELVASAKNKLTALEAKALGLK